MSVSLVHEFHEIALAHRSQLQDPRAHEVESLPFARYRGKLVCALARQITHTSHCRESRMQHLVLPTSRHDPQPVGIEIQGGRNAARRGVAGMA
jgi:hypothetical protein